MGKAAMCIRMLQLLNTGRIYKISELASLLDTNPRNIIEYKKELDEMASDCNYEFYIETIPGRYGGYRLHGEAILPLFDDFTYNEKEAMLQALDYLTARVDFIPKNDYQTAMGKILSSIPLNDLSNDNKNVMVINRFPLSMTQGEIKERYNDIKKAIKDKNKIHFTYLTQKNVLKDRLLEPYELFMYNNTWFVIGWLYSENHPGVYWFKLNRMQSLNITNEKFKIWKYYKRSDYIDEFGFKADGEWHHIEFIAYNSYASLCKERVYGKNQVVEPIDDNSTKVSVDMQNKEKILVFVLGFGKNIDVLEPQWLKDELADVAGYIANKYK